MKRVFKFTKKAILWYLKQTEGYYYCPSGMIPMNY